MDKTHRYTGKTQEAAENHRLGKEKTQGRYRKDKGKTKERHK